MKVMTKVKTLDKLRPSDYSPDMHDRVLHLFLQGYTFARMAREFKDLPSSETLWKWHKELPEFRSAILSAREFHADALVQETLDIADNDFDASRARNRLMARQWIASKFKPKDYGDKLDINVKSVSITAALTEARARVGRPVCDQLNARDVQAIDDLTQIVHRPADKETAGLDDGGPIDIFS